MRIIGWLSVHRRFQGRYKAMKIEWDTNKARANLRKHGVSFQEAATALHDIMTATGADPDHSVHEFRYITFGMSERGRVLVVSHTDRGEVIRIITARVASRRERKIYEEG
jgi:uncharacterized protein